MSVLVDRTTAFAAFSLWFSVWFALEALILVHAANRPSSWFRYWSSCVIFFRPPRYRSPRKLFEKPERRLSERFEQGTCRFRVSRESRRNYFYSSVIVERYRAAKAFLPTERSDVSFSRNLQIFSLKQEYASIDRVRSLALEKRHPSFP